MIIDTSALLAILLGEPERDDFVVAIGWAERRLLPATCLLEAGLKLARFPGDVLASLDDAVRVLRLDVVDFNAAQAREAIRARVRYGGAPARLNFGDCMVYALAKASGEPLLFKGDDFSHTDVDAVPLPSA